MLKGFKIPKIKLIKRINNPIFAEQLFIFKIIFHSEC